jgi:hypothetical protein
MHTAEPNSLIIRYGSSNRLDHSIDAIDTIDFIDAIEFIDAIDFIDFIDAIDFIETFEFSVFT